MAGKQRKASGKAKLLSEFVGARLQEAAPRRRRGPRQDVQPPAYKRATFYLRPDQLKALKLRAVEEERELSAVVREAVDRFLASAR